MSTGPLMLRPTAQPHQLVGRAAERALIDAALDAAPARGSALVFRGEPGIGKTVLLDLARDQARARGMRVLATAGVEAERELAYAGLGRLLRPLLSRADELPGPQRAMLLHALGVTDESEGDLFLVGLATLALLASEAARRPLLVTIDDLHWLDSASHDVLAFVARRVENEPVVVLGAARPGHELSLPEHALGALGARDAEALLDARAPDLPAALRRRLLEEAAGNPLALTELPATVESADAALLPLSARLEQAFAGRHAQTGAATRALLLVFAADVTSSLGEVLAAGERLLGYPVGPALVQPALDAGLVALDRGSLRFRHPLVGSAVYQAAAPEQRRAAHAALAAAIADQPDRRAQHRAHAATGPDEDVARDLEALGERSLRRGAALQASAALARAAELSTDPGAKVRRLLLAAEQAFEAGRADLVQALVEQARRETLSEHDVARVEWLSEIFHDGSGPGQGAAERVLRLVGLGRRAGEDGDTRLALALLFAAALRCWWGGSDDAVRNEVVEAISSLPGPPAEPQRVAAIATAHPLEHGPEVSDLIREAGPADARGAYLLGMAGHATGDYDQSQRQFAIAAERLREQGRLALLAQAQVMRSVECVLLGDFALADAAATEAAALAAETRQPIWLAGATGSLAAIAGVRGEDDAARELSARAHATLESTGTAAVLGWLCVTHGLIELSAARFDEAYASLRRIFDPDDPAHHLRDQFMGVAYLADAAAGRGETGEARRIVAALGRLAARSPLIGLRGGLDYARPLLARDEDADDEFRAALAAPWSSRRFERERLNLAYGAWLRRRRRVVESREPLRLALSGFEALGLAPWAERARGELRAAGEGTVTRAHEAWRDLSAQELEIARLAAAGMSNREIGHRLYLSHRTVASHLYRIFPKLGITSRAQLNAVLPPS